MHVFLLSKVSIKSVAVHLNSVSNGQSNTVCLVRPAADFPGE